MTLPKPNVALDHVCSVVHDNIVYTYSAGAFQSLELAPGAEWKKLPQGEAVDGGVCVDVNPGDPSQAALWIVGGQSSRPEYTGLQRYAYSTGTWESINAQVPVAQNRRWHGAAYLKATNQIITYAGNTDGVQHISETGFAIRAAAPFDTEGYPSAAPAGTNPILLRWSDSQIAMVGGSAGNTKVMLFDSAVDGWTDSKITLAEPIPKDTSVVKAVIVDGDDGSKHLVTFDLSVIPNKVDRTVLAGAGGAFVQLATVVNPEAEGTPATVRRDLTMDSWPTLNDTFAPDVTRVNFALAEGDGKIVLVGGNPEDPLSIFDTRDYAWENAALSLSSEQEVLKVESSSAESESQSSTSSKSTKTKSTSSTASASSLVSSISSTSATATSSSLASSAISDASAASADVSASSSASAAAAAGSGGGGLDGNAILGIVLGTITFAMIILGLLLFCIRRKRLQRQALVDNHNMLARQASSRRQVEKEMPSEFEKELNMGDPGVHPTFRHGHQPAGSAGSYSSMAILMGQINQQKGTDLRKSSATTFFSRTPKDEEAGVPMPPMQGPGRSLTSDEKGVSFAPTTGGQPRPTPPAGVINGDGTRRSSGWNRYWSGGSALNILGFGNGNGNGAAANGNQNAPPQSRMNRESEQSNYSNQNRITQDSATVPPLNFEGRLQMNRVVSGSPTVANYPGKFLLNEGQSGTIERPVSAASSGYSSGVPESVRETWGPITDSKKPWGADRAPSSVYTESIWPTPLGADSSPAKQYPKAPPVPEGLSMQRQMPLAVTSSDMSWLNLGEIQKQNASYNAADNRI